jgi:hypothetical protein
MSQIQYLKIKTTSKIQYLQIKLCHRYSRRRGGRGREGMGEGEREPEGELSSSFW